MAIAGICLGAFAAIPSGVIAAFTWLHPEIPVSGLAEMPDFMRLLYEDPRRLPTFFLLASLLLVVAGVGLLKRTRWGRVVSTIWLVLASAWTAFAFPASLLRIWSTFAEESVFRLLVWPIMLFQIGLALFFLVLFSWIGRQLWSTSSASYFDPPSRSSDG